MMMMMMQRLGFRWQSLVLLVVLLLIITIDPSVDALDAKCNDCKNLVNMFKKGMERTAKGNFGGGNTDWENRKLGNYLTSETRFEEILEKLCGSDHSCQKLVETQEDTLLEWFRTKQTDPESDLFEHLCIVNSDYCCYEDEYGPECKDCPKNWGKICSGNGDCEGAGSRSGTGKCDCDLGFEGELCDKCGVGYYEVARNESSVTCEECHETCGRCNGTGTENCFECKRGYVMNSTGLCEDIDECLFKSPCKEREFCENTVGSYTCYECDPACGTTCDGLGPNRCKGECNSGFTRVYKPTNPDEYIKCEDIDECESNPCGGQLRCVNNYGGYDCIGKDHVDQVKKSREEEKRKSEKNDDDDDDNEDQQDEEIDPESLTPLRLNPANLKMDL